MKPSAAANVPHAARCEPGQGRTLSPNVAALGWVSMLTAVSSAMIYGLLPIFLTQILGIAISTVGVIEGTAEAASSFAKIASGATSDWLGRRKPLVVVGYTLSVVTKTVYPLAESWLPVFGARLVDRLGKGVRDAPRDAFLTDLTATPIRGAGFGLRLALAIAGFVIGPLIAVGLMRLSGDDFRLVFGFALIPAYLSIFVLVIAVKELPFNHNHQRAQLSIYWRDIAELPRPFWWVVMIASLLSLARLSPAFLVLKASKVGVSAAFVPLVLVVVHLVFSATAYPFGILADRVDRRRQLCIGAIILVSAELVLASAGTIWLTAVGAALWGLQFGATQGLLGATIADAAPDAARGTAFGIYDVAVGATTFVASAGAGALWASGGPAMAFGAGTLISAVTALMLLLRPWRRGSPPWEGRPHADRSGKGGNRARAGTAAGEAESGGQWVEGTRPRCSRNG